MHALAALHREVIVYPNTATEVVRVSPANANGLIPNATDPPVPAYAVLAGLAAGSMLHNWLFWWRWGMECFCTGFPRR